MQIRDFETLLWHEVKAVDFDRQFGGFGRILFTMDNGSQWEFQLASTALPAAVAARGIDGLVFDGFEPVKTVEGCKAKVFELLYRFDEEEPLEITMRTAGVLNRDFVPAQSAVILPGWKCNKLLLKSAPNGKRPGVFAYGGVEYTVPGGDAWEAVCRLINAGAFDGHGLRMKTPGDLFRRGHRAFFSERMGRNESGWFIKTL